MFKNKLKKNTERGQSLSEVALFLTLVVVVAILVLTDLGTGIVNTLQAAAAAM